MSNQFWLQNSNIEFPLAAATKLLTGDPEAAPDFAAIEAIFANDQLNIGDLTLLDTEHLGQILNRTAISLASARNVDDWGSEHALKQLLTSLAPIIADGQYLEFESDYDTQSHCSRFIIAGDKVIEDFPMVAFEDPAEVVRRHKLGIHISPRFPNERNLDATALIELIGESTTPGLVSVVDGQNQPGIAYVTDDGDLIIANAPAEDGTPRYRTPDLDSNETFIAWLPER